MSQVCEVYVIESPNGEQMPCEVCANIAGTSEYHARRHLVTLAAIRGSVDLSMVIRFTLASFSSPDYDYSGVLAGRRRHPGFWQS